jgi:hypothetical protein
MISGDTDVPVTFSDTQHNASMNVAIIAVQDELTYLIADRLIPSERKTTGAITTSAGQRTYTLASDFIRFYGNPAKLYNSTQNRMIYEYPGGLDVLSNDIFNYASQPGSPNWWYFEPTTTDKIGLFQVPNAIENWTYDYEGSVLVTNASDTLPFHAVEQDNMFTLMAARRFKFMFEDVGGKADVQAILDLDSSYRSSKAALINLIKGKNPSRYYASHYV